MCNDPNNPQVSIASPSDLARLSEIHGRVSFADPLARCTIKKPHTLVKYIDVGRFHYAQAFANNDAFVLKATNKTSGEIVGCAWLQLYGLREKDTNWATLCQSGFSLPDVMRADEYYDIHTEIHRQRQRALSKNWMPHYCIRALDILNNLPPVRRKLIHRELISFASQLKPDHVFFAHHSQASEMMNSFLEEEWESAGDIVLELVNCPTENKTLRCWLRPRAGEPHAEPQTSLSQASLSRVPHSLQPGWERITDWLSQVAPGFAPITTDPAIRVNPHNSNLDARQAHSPIGKPKTCSGLNESAQSALQQDMMPEIQISSQAHDSIDVSKTCFGLDESSQCTLQHDVMPESQIPRSATSNQHGSGYDDFLARWGVNDQQSSRYYNDSAHWGVIHQQILGYSEFYRPEPWGVNQQQPLEHLQFQYPRFHQEQQYQRPQQGQLAQTNEPSQPRQQIPPTSEPEQFLQPQQSDNQAVSSPPKPLAPYPTITINFLADGVRPFDIDGGYCSEFRYLSYPNISTDVTVSFLMSTLRLQNVGMKGITVMLVRGKGFWGAGMTILEDSEMAEKTLAELGWGWEWRTVWLAVEM